MNVSRKQMRVGVIWLALLALVAAGYWSMHAAKGRLNEAMHQEQQCQKMTKEIKALLDRPGFAALGVDSPSTITARAEEAKQQANVQSESLIRIEPQSAVRLRDSPYRLRPTRLELRGVTLEQVISFTHGMIDEAQGTTIRDLRLTMVDGDAGQQNEAELWTAELVLTQLIFSPLAR